MANVKDAIEKPIKNVSGKIKRTIWVAVIESVIIAILGILFITSPFETIIVLAQVLGVFLIAFGIYQVVNYFVSGGQNDLLDNSLLSGIVYVLIGVAFIVTGPFIFDILRYIVGIWLIYESLVRMNTAIKLHSVGVSLWGYILALAIIMLIIGIFVTFATFRLNIQIIGGIMIAAAVISIVGELLSIGKVDSIEKKLLGKLK